MPNRLAQETSPYLLQHKDNPVDWFAWGPEALKKSQEEDKPIFLSIGYSACHWCHVMERESFEDEDIAQFLNDNYVPVKVDREERPDLDQIYMNAVQAMTGRGGWPMSVFLTPDLEPFYGGTYWPPRAGMGMPGFDQVLHGVIDAWQNRREQACQQAAKLTEALRQMAQGEEGPSQPLDVKLLEQAEASLQRVFDFTYGGFGGAPKFPHPMGLRFLLRMWQRTERDGLLDMVKLNLDKMAYGGIYDQLGGGFHRYSVDQQWLVPHFEKMLYDNALLTDTYLHAFLATGEAEYARIARETLDYVLREMRHANGGFYSTQDADSEGVEGKFFVWTPQEIREALGEAAAETFCRVYDVTEAGNFEGKNILNLPKPVGVCARLMNRDEAGLREELAASRQKLFEIRRRRVHPGLDDKVLVSWNGLMIDTMARAAGVLDQPQYLEAAIAAVDFIWSELRRDDGRLLHTWRNGRARFDAYLDDYAALLCALVSVYEATFDERFIDRAVQLADILLEFFHDSDGGGFFYTATDHERLISRQKDLSDSAVPSGAALAATGLVRLGKLTGRRDLLDAAVGTLQAAVSLMTSHPIAAGQMLLALDLHLGPTYELVTMSGPSGTEAADLVAGIRRRCLPNHVLACRGPDTPAYRSSALDGLFNAKETVSDQLTLYVCENFTCRQPAVGKQAVEQAIHDLS